MVDNFNSGGAAINQLCATFKVELDVLPINIKNPTHDFTQKPAMSENAFIDTINIFGIDGGETIVINDILGKEIFKGVGVEEINLSSFEKGTYFLTLSKGNQSSTFKVIKK